MAYDARMDADHARDLLAAQRARIEAALVGSAQIEAGADPDPFEVSDAAPDMVDAEVDMGLAGALRAELEAIERAERRLADGTYGRSVESGEPIPDARLEVVPWAERTTEEQARFDATSR